MNTEILALAQTLSFSQAVTSIKYTEKGKEISYGKGWAAIGGEPTTVDLDSSAWYGTQKSLQAPSLSYQAYELGTQLAVLLLEDGVAKKIAFCDKEKAFRFFDAVKAL